jgi:acyl transferase domain-containing protein
VFRESVLESDAIYKNVTGRSLIAAYGLFDEKTHAEEVLGDVWPIAVTLPALTIVQLALFDTLSELGIRPDAVLGHSAGETAVLYASGAASKTAAVELSIARGRGMGGLERQSGTMAALNCSASEAERLIASVKSEKGPGQLEIGCYNSINSVTLSGSEAYVEHVLEIASQRGFFARKLRTRVPVHSSMMEFVRDDYQGLVKDVFSRHELRDPFVQVFSSESGCQLRTKLDADYFWANTRGPVRFKDAVDAIIEQYNSATFIELSPHPVLSGYLTELGGQSSFIVCPMRRANAKKAETDVEVLALLTALGALTVAGHNVVNHSKLVGSHVKPSRTMPRYPLTPKHVAYANVSLETSRYTQRRLGPLNHAQLRLHSRTHPSLAQHVIKGESIMPAAGYLEMVSGYGSLLVLNSHNEVKALEFGARKVWNTEFLSVIALSAPRPVPVEVKLSENRWEVRSSVGSEVAVWPPKVI